MKTNFDRCLAEILKHEGGYVDHPSDPGGATNMGITIGTLRDYRGKATKEDVKNLTSAEAAKIYKAWYWQPVRGDDLPAGLDLVAFDAAVNSGVSRSSRWLQGALGVAIDGKVGPETVAAALRADTASAARRALQERMRFLRGLSHWSTFGKGWTRRLDGVERVALEMIASPARHPGVTRESPAPQGGIGAVIAALLAAVAAGATYIYQSLVGG